MAMVNGECSKRNRRRNTRKHSWTKIPKHRGRYFWKTFHYIPRKIFNENSDGIRKTTSKEISAGKLYCEMSCSLMITFKGNPMEDFLNNSYKIFWRKQGCKKCWKNHCKKLEKTARIIVTLHEKKNNLKIRPVGFLAKMKS